MIDALRSATTGFPEAAKLLTSLPIAECVRCGAAMHAECDRERLRMSTNPAARFLIVDNDHANVYLLRRVLLSEGYEHIESTTDSRQAVALCASLRPDLILLDLMMPHLDGVDVLEKLRTVVPDHGPVLILTADVSPAAKERVLAAGAVDVVLKPLEFQVLRPVIRRLLAEGPSQSGR
jgi:CheY-like chemotaxis protein